MLSLLQLIPTVDAHGLAEDVVYQAGKGFAALCDITKGHFAELGDFFFPGGAKKRGTFLMH